MTKKTRLAAAALALLLATAAPALPQGGLGLVPLGYCQMTALSAATLITAANCVRASFTATGSGTNLTASSVTGTIRVGDLLAGTGVPADTRVVSQTSGTAGGAGVYVTSRATTSSAASLTSGGVPLGSTTALLSIESQAIRYADDGSTPTASAGMPIAVGQAFQYSSTLSALRLIEQAASAKANVLFYK